MSRDIDLIPKDYTTGRNVQRKGGIWIVIGVLALLAVLGMHLTMASRLGKLEASVSPLRERVLSMRAWEAQVDPLARRLEDARDRYRLVTKLTDEPFMEGLIADLAGAAGEGLWLQELRVEQGESEGGQRYGMQISGVASSNADLIIFMAALSASEHVDGLALNISKTVRNSEDVAHIDFEVAGNLK